MNYNSNPNPSDSNSTSEDSFEFRFANIKESFFITAQQLLQRKFSSFLNRTSSLTQFLRVISTNFLPFGLNLLFVFGLVVTYYSNSIDGNCSIGLFESTHCLYESGLGFCLKGLEENGKFFFSKGYSAQTLLTFVPYTESRWRLLFGQIFALDIQICGPNLILVRDGSFSVQLNSSLNELAAIPRLKVNTVIKHPSLID